MAEYALLKIQVYFFEHRPGKTIVQSGQCVCVVGNTQEGLFPWILPRPCLFVQASKSAGPPLQTTQCQIFRTKRPGVQSSTGTTSKTLINSYLTVRPQGLSVMHANDRDQLWATPAFDQTNC